MYFHDNASAVVDVVAAPDVLNHSEKPTIPLWPVCCGSVRTKIVSGIVTAGLIMLLTTSGCETRVIQDNSVDARLSRSMPAGSLRRGTGGDESSGRLSGTPVHAGYIANPAAPGNWVNGFGAPAGP